MMTSSNGNIFRVTGHLCGEFTGPRWIPNTKASDAEFDVFFDLRLNKQLSKQCWGWWFETLSCPLRRHCNDSPFPPLDSLRKGPVMERFYVSPNNPMCYHCNVHWKMWTNSPPLTISTHRGLVTSYWCIDLGQHRLQLWLFSWRQQAIPWSNVDLSWKVFCGIPKRATSLGVLMNLCSQISLSYMLTPRSIS